MMSSFLKHKDPVEKAKRNFKSEGASQQQVTGPVRPVRQKLALTAVSGLRQDQVAERRPIPAAIQHAIQLRDQGRCVHTDAKGNRCSEKRFLHFHHIKPVQEHGNNSVENLALLCSSHHRLLHWQHGARAQHRSSG
jgi:5-methylcytosine-specific restriction endonuclease McrA